MAGRNPYFDGPPSDHFDGTRFFNPAHPSTDRGPRELWRWMSGRGSVRWPSRVPITPAVPPAEADAPRITMVGHASLLIQVAGLNILTDPVWSERVSPVSFAGPRRVTEPGIAFADLPRIDAVLVSHNHYDHLDLATLRRLHAAHRPLIVLPLGNDAIVGKAVAGARLSVGDWGSRHAIGPEATVTLTPANHWSSRGLRDRRMALWAGFMIETRAGRIWFAGDTGYGDGSTFHAIRQRHQAPDIALIPIGAYEPRWFMAAQHANPEEAVRIFDHVGAARAIGIHWGTFKLTDEGREDPRTALAAALARAGIAPERFVAAEPGDVFTA